MLRLQNLLFWTGLGLTGSLAEFGPRLTVLALLGAGLSPPVFSALGTIWKDVGMGSALLLAFALLWWAQARSSRWALWLALPCLGYAIALRYNAAVAVLPLALWAGFIARRDLASSRSAFLRSTALGLLVFILLAGIALASNRWLTTRRQYPLQQILMHDLIAISVGTGTIRLPASTRMTYEPATLDDFRCLYVPDNAVAAYSAKDDACRVRIHKLTSPQPMADLEAMWADTVWREPRIYLAHRWHALAEQFAWQRPRVCYPLNSGFEVQQLRLGYTYSPLQVPAERALARFAYATPLFRGWIYFVVLAAVTVVAGRGPGRAPLRALGASGLAYGLAYFFVSTTCSYRMNWWYMVAALVSLIVAAGLHYKDTGTNASVLRSRGRMNTREHGPPEGGTNQ
jgi:hypothetical protein